MLQARRQPKLVVKLKSANSRTQTQLGLEDQWKKDCHCAWTPAVEYLIHKAFLCLFGLIPDSSQIYPCVHVCACMYMFVKSTFFLFSVLPDTLLHCLNCIHLLVLHRHLLADALLMDRPTMQNAGSSHCQWFLSKPITFTALGLIPLSLFQI